MLYSIGETLFRIGLAVTVSYFVVYTLASASGIPVPRELAEANAMVSALQGKIGGLGGVLALGVGAYAGVIAVSTFLSYLTGRSIDLEVARVKGLFVFTGLYAVAFSGVMTLVNLLASYVAWAIPPLAGVAVALRYVGTVVTTVSLTYYIAVKVLGLPTF